MPGGFYERSGCVLFLGEYEHVVDAKGRLAIPAEVRDVFNPEIHGSGFVASAGGNGALWLFPERTFHAIARELQGKLLGDKELGEYERTIFSQSKRVPLDTAGRVRIPEAMLKQHNLSGKIMVLGVGDHLELVEPQRWEQDRAGLAPANSEVWNRARQAVAMREEDYER